VQDALDWVQSRTGRRVLETTRLYGGLTSDVDEVKLEDGELLVLRRYTAWRRGAADTVENEAAVLKRLAHSEVSAPRLVAYDASLEIPVVLMTRLPGRVWLTPPDFDSWLGQMAHALVAIHGVDPDPSDPGEAATPLHVEVPDWTKRPALWKKAAEIVAQAPPKYMPVFVHNDYQHFNMLWSEGRMTGVVDWTMSGAGHRDHDVAHCRLNLAILFSIEIAERFREIYETESGRTVDPVWDLRGLLGYDQGWKQFIPVQVAGRAPVDAAGMDDRVEGVIERIISRM
jgi:aminoglycoside phosphotransferase (APT) family kinase protein